MIAIGTSLRSSSLWFWAYLGWAWDLSLNICLKFNYTLMAGPLRSVRYQIQSSSCSFSSESFGEPWGSGGRHISHPYCNHWLFQPISTNGHDIQYGHSLQRMWRRWKCLRFMPVSEFYTQNIFGSYCEQVIRPMAYIKFTASRYYHTCRLCRHYIWMQGSCGNICALHGYRSDLRQNGWNRRESDVYVSLYRVLQR